MDSFWRHSDKETWFFSEFLRCDAISS